MARELRLQPGAVFAGVYEIASLLGQGTMGSVYRVIERPAGTVRALKLMKEELLSDPKFPARFAQEALIGTRIASPHIVQVVASGVDPKSGLPWLVMEHLEGSTLGEWLESTPPPAAALARSVLDQLFTAIAAAHAANIVHRDLKPENVIITSREDAPFVKVLDFGIAKIVRESQTLTGTTPGLGTPLWTAPEQSKEGVSLRPTADVWALGLITFRMLTGKMFWKSSNDASSNAYQIALELMRAPIPPASERAAELAVAAPLPAGFDGWFARSVTRDPSARFASAAEAHAALLLLLDGPPLRRAARGTVVMAATPSSPPPRAAPSTPPPAAPSPAAAVPAAPVALKPPPDRLASAPKPSPLASTVGAEPAIPDKPESRAWLWAVFALLAFAVGAVLFARLRYSR